DYVGGTSIGGVMGALYAAGYSARELLEISRRTDWNDLFTDEPSRRSLPYDARRQDSMYSITVGFQNAQPLLASGVSPGQSIVERLDDLLSAYAVAGSFDRLPKPLRVVATNLATGEEKVFREGDLKTAVRASLAVPGAFTPVSYQGEVYIDGDWSNALPVDRLAEFDPDYIVAVRLGELQPVDELDGAPEVLDQASRILRLERLEANLSRADVVISPDVSDYGVASFSADEALIERGREAARRAADELRALSARVEESVKRPPEIDGPSREAATRSGTRHLPDEEFPVTVTEITYSRDSAPESADAEIREALLGRTTTQEIRESVYALYDSGRYRFVTYTLSPHDDGETVTLDIDLSAKATRTTEVQAGFSFRSDLWTPTAPGFTSHWNLLMRELAVQGSRWSTSVWIGEVPSAASEFRYPLAGRSAATASLYGLNEIIRFYEERRIASVYAVPRFGARLGVVTVVFDAGELWLDGVGEWTEPVPRSGALREITAEGFRVGGNVAGRLDTTDRYPYPRTGTQTEAGYHIRYAFRPRRLYHHGWVQQRLYVPVFRESSVMYQISVASDFQSGLPGFEHYTLGGPQSFPGLHTGEMRGNHLAAIAAEARLRIVDLPPGAGGSVYATVRAAAGRAWAGAFGTILDDPGVPAGFGVGIGADTILGRAGLGVGITTDGRIAAGLVIGNEMGVPFHAEGID
ncbi:MAG: patatin-like phospholipase family protein, partial [Spirochaetota bacterium]